MMPFLGFWENISRPIIALSPMDGVTDFACRAMVARHGRPDVIFTEFTTTAGLFHAPDRILQDFEYSEVERPIVAQIYGNNPDDFYRATHLVCELGFDGVDINMGCPSKLVVQHNCGAKLITVPGLALEIIRATRAAIQDWSRGQTLEQVTMPDRVREKVYQMNLQRVGKERPASRKLIPYSIKTRIGYDREVIESWVATLLSEQPAAISIHGRTLKQLYRGIAAWDAIARAVKVAQGSGSLILGNGDITSLAQAAEAIRQTGVDGVLIGRNSIGNPWIFQPKDRLKESFRREGLTFEAPHVDRHERVRVALEHAEYFKSVRGEIGFRSLFKHLSGYLSHFAEASSLRSRAMQARSFQDLIFVLNADGSLR